MKRISELTENELLEMTDDQVTKTVDYECAVQGVVMLPPHPGPAPVCPPMPRDTKTYEVCGVITMDADHAARILEVVTSQTIYKESHLGNDYNATYLEERRESDYNFPEIKVKSSCSPEQWETIKNEREGHAKAKAAYEQISKLYFSALKDREHINEEIGQRISDARQSKFQRENIRIEYTHYLSLADDNSTVAMNFMLKAKPYIAEEFPGLVQELCPGYGNPDRLPAEPLEELMAEIPGGVSK